MLSIIWMKASRRLLAPPPSGAKPVSSMEIADGPESFSRRSGRSTAELNFRFVRKKLLSMDFNPIPSTHMSPTGERPREQTRTLTSGRWNPNSAPATEASHRHLRSCRFHMKPRLSEAEPALPLRSPTGLQIEASDREASARRKAPQPEQQGAPPACSSSATTHGSIIGDSNDTLPSL